MTKTKQIQATFRASGTRIIHKRRRQTTEQKVRRITDRTTALHNPQMTRTVLSGVPQGTVLGPLMFLCHINDLPESAESTVRLFADDCLLYREIHTFQDHLTLQADLKQLEIWAKKWDMRFNAQKCYILSTRSKSSYLYSLDNVILQQVQRNPYLGVLLSDDLKWSSHISNIFSKAGSTVGFLRQNLRNCPQECRRLASITLVRSTLEYGATVWDPYLRRDIERLERVQRQAARFITRDYKSRSPGSVSDMLKNLNLPPLEEHRRQLRLNFLNRISEGPRTPYRQVFSHPPLADDGGSSP